MMVFCNFLEIKAETKKVVGVKVVSFGFLYSCVKFRRLKMGDPVYKYFGTKIRALAFGYLGILSDLRRFIHTYYTITKFFFRYHRGHETWKNEKKLSILVPIALFENFRLK